MGKDKLKRFAQMGTFSNVIQPEIEEVLNTDHRFKNHWKEEVYNNQNELILELGCGKGEYTIGLAKQTPTKNYLGIDIKGARMWKGARQALEQDLKNVRFLRTRIDFISSFFGPSEVDEIWITFPDPQLKESRARKRLTHPFFLNRYREFLNPDGHVNLKTDSKELYDYTLEIIESEKHHLVEASSDLYNPSFNLEDEQVLEALRTIQTFYESKFLEEGKNICYVKFQLNREVEDKREK